MKKQAFFLLIITSLIFNSCSDELDLEKSEYISDDDYPELPEYSEWGYNTFGAYYDKDVFVSNSYDMPMKVIVTNGFTSFIFQGQKLGFGHSDMIMEFKINNFLPADAIFDDLLHLNDSTIDLVDVNCNILITVNSTSNNVTLLNGKLEFRRAQKLFIDTKPADVILSGFFDFQALINGEPKAITNGRFDIAIGPMNFFAY
ncbi:hypothetical protein ACFL6I_28690 [candidate division KSB1 bacterium]